MYLVSQLKTILETIIQANPSFHLDTQSMCKLWKSLETLASLAVYYK